MFSYYRKKIGQSVRLSKNIFFAYGKKLPEIIRVYGRLESFSGDG